MSSLKQQLQVIFPDIHNIYDEAKKKLMGSWCFVNNELVQIYDIPSDSVITADVCGKKKHIEVQTLKTWLPQTGIYPLESGQACFVVKQPKRQWHRSFMHSFYNVSSLEPTLLPKNYLQLIAASQKTNIFVDTKQNIWWWSKIIGFVKNNETIVCTNKYYKQELIDWCKTI